MRRERFYLTVGAGGLALVLAAWLLRRAMLAPFAQLLYLVAAVVVVIWMVAGVSSARRQEREEREAAAARVAAEQAAREARQASERAVRAVMAKRTTSYGGKTITVHRASSGHANAPSTTAREDGSREEPAGEAERDC